MTEGQRASGGDPTFELLDGFEIDPELIARGWQYRFMGAGPRLREMVNLYESLGFEVRLEPVRPLPSNEDCRDCQILTMLHFKSVYTRKPDSTVAAGDEAARSG